MSLKNLILENKEVLERRLGVLCVGGAYQRNTGANLKELLMAEVRII